MTAYQLNIIHLYPDLLNLYGDKGNLACLEKRLTWRGIGAQIQSCTGSDAQIDLDSADILFLGGGSDREQELVCGFLQEKREALRQYVESGGVLIAVCGGYQLLGEYYQTASGKKIQGLNILDIRTYAGKDRLIGNIVLKSELFDRPIVGFENHGGRTEIGKHTPLGKVVYGRGNTGESGYEGILYKNTIGTYLHGPLFPKNPQLCDYLLTCALKRKYPDFPGLSPLDDALENQANQYIADRFKPQN